MNDKKLKIEIVGDNGKLKIKDGVVTVCNDLSNSLQTFKFKDIISIQIKKSALFSSWLSIQTAEFPDVPSGFLAKMHPMTIISPQILSSQQLSELVSFFDKYSKEHAEQIRKNKAKSERIKIRQERKLKKSQLSNKTDEFISEKNEKIEKSTESGCLISGIIGILGVIFFSAIPITTKSGHAQYDYSNNPLFLIFPIMVVAFIVVFYQRYHSVKKIGLESNLNDQTNKHSNAIPKKKVVQPNNHHSNNETRLITGNKHNKWTRKGIEYYKSGEYKEASIAFSNAIANGQNTAQVYFYRACSYQKLNDKQKLKNDILTAAKLGHPKALELLNKSA